MHEQAMEEENAPWELLYNLGTALLQGDRLIAAGRENVAERCLEQAEESCLEVRRCRYALSIH